MSTRQTVLLLGATGRTGQRVLMQLLRHGINVRVVVRSAAKLPTGAVEVPELRVFEADLFSLSEEDLPRQVRGCDAVISCLGHVTNVKGIFGPPRDLVVRATTRLCRTIESLQPAKPVKFILMSSVSVNHPGRLDSRRGVFDKATVWMLRRLLPPAKDNQQAADFLYNSIGLSNPFVEWAVVRPDTLREGDVSEYTLHEGIVSSLFAPDSTNIANVADYMYQLATSEEAWDNWKGKFPVVINAASN